MLELAVYHLFPVYDSLLFVVISKLQKYLSGSSTDTKSTKHNLYPSSAFKAFRELGIYADYRC